jgi:hypothetical protein
MQGHMFKTASVITRFIRVIQFYEFLDTPNKSEYENGAVAAKVCHGHAPSCWTLPGIQICK